MNTIEVSKITLNLKGKSIDLTVEEAKKLQSELAALLGTVRAYPVYVQPSQVFVNPAPTWPSFWGELTCGGNTGPTFLCQPQTVGLASIANRE